MVSDETGAGGTGSGDREQQCKDLYDKLHEMICEGVGYPELTVTDVLGTIELVKQDFINKAQRMAREQEDEEGAQSD